jgi:hypothetical protein
MSAKAKVTRQKAKAQKVRMPAGAGRTAQAFIALMSLAPCNVLYCGSRNLCWPCRARIFMEGAS